MLTVNCLQVLRTDPVTTDPKGEGSLILERAKTPTPAKEDQGYVPHSRSYGRSQEEDIVCTTRNCGDMYDVGSSHPGAGEGPKGLAVRQLKRYASWVQNVVRQFGLYPPWSFRNVKEVAPSTRGPERTNLWCTCCRVSGIAG